MTPLPVEPFVEAARGLGRGLSQAFRGIAESAVPEAGARGTAAAPAILERALKRMPAAGELPAGVREAGLDVPFAGPESMRRASRTVPAPATRKTIADITDDAKVWLGSLFLGEAGLPKKMREDFGETRAFERRIREQVELELKDDVFKPISGLGRQTYAKARQLSDFMVNADRLAQIAHNKVDTVDGLTKAELEGAVPRLWAALDGDTRAVHESVRQKYDDAFETAVERGWVSEESRNEAYSPIKRMAMVLDAVSKDRGEEGVMSEPLVQFLRRGHEGGHRNTDAVTLLSDYLSVVRRRVAEEDLLTKVLNDQTINFTDRSEIKAIREAGGPLPPGLAYYVPRPGKIGYMGAKDPIQQAMDGAIDGLTARQTAAMKRARANELARGFVLPKRVAEALENFNPRIPGESENRIYRGAQAFTRMFTSYNPAVTSVNFVSDHALALTTLAAEGGPGRVLGFLREWPDAFGSAIGGVFFGKGGRKYARALHEGLASSTFTYDVGGAPVSGILKELHETDSRNLLKKAVPGALQFLANLRQAGELTPKIAAGEEALKRLGNLAEYGRVGRNITVDFSKGPAIMRNPTARFMAPFYTFFGAVTPKILALSTDKSTRGTMLAGIAAVPTAIMMWNYQDDEFAAVERSLPEFEQLGLHVIVAGPDGRPLKDPTGKPVVKRIQYWVPEQVASMFGLGNLPSRLRRVTERYQTPAELAGSVAAGAGRFWAGSLMPARMAIEMGYKRNLLTGQEESGSDLVTGLVPQVRMTREHILAAKTWGQKEAAKRTMSALGGMTQTSITRTGPGIKNAALVDAKRDFDDANMRVRSLLINGETAKAEEAMKRRDKARDRLARVAGVAQAQQEERDRERR